MVRPTPKSTLFPYTTLFRSYIKDRALAGTYAVVREMAPSALIIGNVGAPQLIRQGETPPLSIDRKSTRLNSSHVAISYAVFCLKKKIFFVTQHRSSYGCIFS